MFMLCSLMSSAQGTVVPNKTKKSRKMEVKNYQFVILDCTMGDKKKRSKSCLLLKEAGFRVIRFHERKFEESSDSFLCRLQKLLKRYKPDVVVVPGVIQKEGFSRLADDIATDLKRENPGVIIVQSWDCERDPSRSNHCIIGFDIIVYRDSFINDEDYRNEMIYRVKTLACDTGDRSTYISAD